MQILQHRKGPNKGRWYTDFDESLAFDTKAEAEAHQRTIVDAAITKRQEAQDEAKRARYAARRKELEEKYSGYKPPSTDKVRLFKNSDKDMDEVGLTNLALDNAKTFMEHQMALRRAGGFSATVIGLGGRHFVMDPGSDIGITPALSRPDLDRGDGFLPLSREGKPKPYDKLAAALDRMAEKYAVAWGRTVPEARQRLGRDLDRITRNSPPRGAYTDEEWEAMTELAAVMRLDKARVPGATRYIRGAFISGAHSFRELLVDKRYVGAGQGGVEALRGEVVMGGEESDGSDIEGARRPEKRDRKHSVERGRKHDRHRSERRAGSSSDSEEGSKSRSRSREASHKHERSQRDSSSDSRSRSSSRGHHGVVREFDTWAEASMHLLRAGTRIRILHHQYDISTRVFELTRDYIPDPPYTSVTAGQYLRWING